MFKASRKSYEKKHMIGKVILNTKTKKYQNHLWLLLIKILIHFEKLKKYSLFEKFYYSRKRDAESKKSYKLTLIS